MRSQFHVAILAGGQRPDPELAAQATAHCQRLICANGGFDTAHDLGLTPNAVVGDLDSLDPELVQVLEKKKIPLRRHPPDKDLSDLELALRLAHSWGATEVTVLGALGGRLDHLIFNLVAGLTFCHEQRMKARLISRTVEALLISGTTTILDRPGWLASVLCLSESSQGVCLEGFEYTLQRATLRRAQSLGLSNRVVAPKATISVDSGLVVAILIQE